MISNLEDSTTKNVNVAFETKESNESDKKNENRKIAKLSFKDDNERSYNNLSVLPVGNDYDDMKKAEPKNNSLVLTL